MKALSVRQPWAWLIVNGHKDVENRTWHSPYIGLLLIHASKTCSAHDQANAEKVAGEHAGLDPTAQLGGIVGAAHMTGCGGDNLVVSSWNALGQWHFTLEDAVPAKTFVAWRGALGFFEIPNGTAMSAFEA